MKLNFFRLEGVFKTKYLSINLFSLLGTSIFSSSLKSAVLLCMFFSLFLFEGKGAYAEEDILNQVIQFEDTHQYEFGIQGGSFLAYDILGVTSKYSPWGAYFSYPTAYGGLELGGNHFRGEDVVFYNYYTSLRIDFNSFDYLHGYFRVGVDFNNYKRKPNSYRTFGFATVSGGHFGGGAYWKVNSHLYTRFDFKLGMVPGRYLVSMVALCWRWGGGDKKEPGN